MIINEEILEFLSYPPLDDEYVLRQKPGLDQYSFFYNTKELITDGVVFSVDKNDNIDVSPAVGIHHSGLEYSELFDILEYGTAKIPPRPFFSVIVAYTEALCKQLLAIEGITE